MEKVFVNSIPKAGTYLVSEILRRAGLHQTLWHVAETAYDDYTRVGRADGRRTPERARTQQPMAETLARIETGQFAVGHLSHKIASVGALKGFQIIFLSRDLRECLVSYVRFMMETGRAAVRGCVWAGIADPTERLMAYFRVDGPVMVQLFRDMAAWLLEPNVTSLRFADLKSPASAPDWLPPLTARLGLILPADPLGLVREALDSDTITKSKSPTVLSTVWSPECQTWWEDCGGPDINRLFGYDS